MLRIPIALVLSVLTTTSLNADDWRMLYGSPARNNISNAGNLPDDFDVVEGTNIKWKAKLGSQSYGNLIVADGHIYVGTNNGNSYLRKYPAQVDVSCLLCFRESDGEFLWQFSAEKLPTGRVHDWPWQGICSSPYVEGDRMWFVSSRGEVICLDTKGYYDDEDDGLARQLEKVQPVFTALNDLRPTAAADNGELQKLRLSTLERIFYAHTSHLKGCYNRKLNLNENSWVISIRNPQTGIREQKLYRLNFGDEQLTISHQATPETVASTSYASILTAGLDEGTVSRPVRELFGRRHIRIPPKPRVETLEPGRRWKLGGILFGTEFEYLLTLDGNVLTSEPTIKNDEQLKEADLVWSFDMMGRLGVSQHNMATCSPLVYGDLLFVCTSNGLDETHLNLPAPNAPSFMAMNKNTGEVLWTDNSPGTNILHGQWSCPAIGEFGGVPQVIFPGGDGWIYSFRADDGKNGKPILLWKFDANRKESKWVLGGSGTRNNVIAPPTIFDGKVYIVTGQDPEHGEGRGDLWCINPTKRGDISAELVLDQKGNVIPHRRLQAVDVDNGEAAVPNPNSGVIWHYDQRDEDGDEVIHYEEEMHRSLASPVIKDGLLYQADFSGIVYCMDAFTGEVYWTHDQFAACWGTPLIADGKVYCGDEDGDLLILEHSKKKKIVNEIYMEDSIKMAPIAVDDTLYIGTLRTLYAISQED